MNRPDIREPDICELLKQVLKDDLPPEAEARMGQQFLDLERTLNWHGSSAEAERPWMHWPLRRGILAFGSAAMLILGIVMQLNGSPRALAHSVEQLKVIVTVSMSLNRAAFMDCTVVKPEAGGENTSYHVLWRANGDARMDMVSAGVVQTIWISDGTISFADSDEGSIRSVPLKTIAPGPAWQPAMEFRTPALLAKLMEERYGLMQTGERRGAGSDEFLIVGKEDRQVVEITVDARTYLPKLLKKCAPDSGRTNGGRICPMEVRFHWNQPISGELFVPRAMSREAINRSAARFGTETRTSCHPRTLARDIY